MNAYSRRLRQPLGTHLLGVLAALVLVLLALASAPAALGAGYRDEVMADGPAAYWRLGETGGTAAASQTGGNGGTYAGGVTLAQPGALPGDTNTAALFDGVNDTLGVPQSATLDATTGVTVELWAKRTKNAAWQVIVGKPGNGQSRFENYAMWFDSSNRVQAYFGNGSTFVSVAWATAIDTNWHHLAATYDNATARLYVDGVLRATKTATVQLTPNPNPLNIGRSNDGGYWFGGTLDEVAIYMTALPASRIQAHFSSAATPPGGGDTIAPTVTLTQPANGSTTSDSTPTFSGTAGTAPGDLGTVTVKVYPGSSASGTPAQTLTATSGTGGAYSVDASPALADGTYSARSEQSDAAGNTGLSSPTTFTVATAGGGDVTPPVVTLTQPANGSTTNNTTPTFAGLGGTALGDDSQVTVKVYTGTSASGSPVRTLTTTRGLAGDYSVNASPALAEGTYTARTEQSDAAGNVGFSSPTTLTIDVTSPTITLTQPAEGSTVTSATPTFAGTAGTATGDSANVTVRVYSGPTGGGTPVQTLSATRQTGGSYSTPASAPLMNGTYTARAEQTDAAGNTGLSGASTFTVAVPTGSDPVVIGAGDIADCGQDDFDDETATLIGQNPGATVVTLGDNEYPGGSNFSCFNEFWGQHKSRIRPAVGDHDLEVQPVAQAYVNYFRDQLTPFGPTAVDPTKLYYSYDLGSWHVVTLNGVCFYYTPGCDTAAQEQWLRADLAAHPNQCTLAVMHTPRFSSGAIHGNSTIVQGLWSALHQGGVELVLSGDDHLYERFGPMDAGGNADAQFGVRQFVVGTGGYSLYPFGVIQPNSQFRNNSNYGLIKLTLRNGAYDWVFLPITGAPIDPGTATCHGAPPPPGQGVEGAPQVRSSASAALNHASLALTINKPAGTTQGDLLMAVVGHQGGSIRNMTPPAGWTAVPNASAFDGTNARIHAWYKAAGASEPASYTFTLTGGSGMALGGGVMAITGANTANPINAAGNQVTSTNTRNLVAPSITTSVARTLLVYGGAVNSPQAYTPPADMGEHWDVRTSGTYNIASSAAAGGFLGPGATGTRAATLSNTARGVAVLIAVAPAGS